MNDIVAGTHQISGIRIFKLCPAMRAAIPNQLEGKTLHHDIFSLTASLVCGSLSGFSMNKLSNNSPAC
jgi:hypothetical protein